MDRYDKSRYENRCHNTIDDTADIFQLFGDACVGFIDGPDEIIIKFGIIKARKIELPRFFKKLCVNFLMKLMLYL